MRIDWYLGFGWAIIATFVACGIAINVLEGWTKWIMYVPFLLVGIHMSIRFRAYSTQPWRRVHHRTMIDYAKLAETELQSSAADGRPFDAGRPCLQLGQTMFSEETAKQFLAERKDYYRSLVETWPQVFLEQVTSDRAKQVLDSVSEDIEASELGPDVLIAKQIEQLHGGKESARYLRALMVGQVR